jgi:hypothetical protein
MYALIFIILDDITWLAENLPNPQQIQKGAVKARKRIRDPPGSSISRTGQASKNSKSLQEKRPREEDTLIHPSHELFPKRARKLSEPSKNQSSIPYPQEPTGEDAVDSKQSHISYWTEKKKWPRTYFENNKMQHLAARKKSIGRKGSNPSLASSLWRRLVYQGDFYHI